MAMDSSVVQRLMRVEEDLLDAIISDGAALEQCAQGWLLEKATASRRRERDRLGPEVN